MSQDYDPRIAEARRIARRLAREEGTSYQAALEAIARRAGANSWPAFVENPTELHTPPSPSPVSQDIAMGSDEDGKWMSDQDRDLLQRICVGLLGTALSVVLGTSLLIGSLFVPGPWSALVETCGTIVCAAGVLVIPSAMSGYVMGIRMGDTRHVMPLRWRLAMALGQGWFIFGVARHLAVG